MTTLFGSKGKSSPFEIANYEETLLTKLTSKNIASMSHTLICLTNQDECCHHVYFWQDQKSQVPWTSIFTRTSINNHTPPSFNLIYSF